MNQLHTIKYVANRTGLSQHAIRAWERRYHALTPSRSETNRRLYSDADLEKLLLLRQAVEAGHAISRIATRSVVELRELVGDIETQRTEFQSHQPLPEPGASPLVVSACLQAIDQLEADRLGEYLTQALTALGVTAFLNEVALPLLDAIGEGWSEGSVRVAQEHMASAVMRTFLGRQLVASAPLPTAPMLLSTTPAGQFHELGALITAIVATSEGWRAMFLGPNLPAEEIAGAAQQAKARVIALSIVYPPDDPGLIHELWELRKQLGPEVHVLVGGSSAAAYRKTLESIDAILLDDIQNLRGALQRLRFIPRKE